jgi:hypothetical protein
MSGDGYDERSEVRAPESQSFGDIGGGHVSEDFVVGTKLDTSASGVIGQRLRWSDRDSAFILLNPRDRPLSER